MATAQVVRRTATAYERLEHATGAADAVVLTVGGDTLRFLAVSAAPRRRRRPSPIVVAGVGAGEHDAFALSVEVWAMVHGLVDLHFGNPSFPRPHGEATRRRWIDRLGASVLFRPDQLPDVGEASVDLAAVAVRPGPRRPVEGHLGGRRKGPKPAG
ncbi:MAG: hypothetical protein WKF43_03380 [Acidimicrobiales bacterium]